MTQKIGAWDQLGQNPTHLSHSQHAGNTRGARRCFHSSRESLHLRVSLLLRATGGG